MRMQNQGMFDLFESLKKAYAENDRAIREAEKKKIREANRIWQYVGAYKDVDSDVDVYVETATGSIKEEIKFNNGKETTNIYVPEDINELPYSKEINNKIRELFDNTEVTEKKKIREALPGAHLWGPERRWLRGKRSKTVTSEANNLPKKVDNVPKEIMDDQEAGNDTAVADYLSDSYGFLVSELDIKRNDDGTGTAYNIVWDTSESTVAEGVVATDGSKAKSTPAAPASKKAKVKDKTKPNVPQTQKPGEGKGLKAEDVGMVENPQAEEKVDTKGKKIHSETGTRSMKKVGESFTKSGERSGTGPRRGSYQRQKFGVGKRIMAGKKCPKCNKKMTPVRGSWVCNSCGYTERGARTASRPRRTAGRPRRTAGRRLRTSESLTRKSLYLCNECCKTFRANESKCTECGSERVEKITGELNEVGVHVDPGTYRVIFFDGSVVELDANSRVDAMNKARVKSPEKRVISSRKIKDLDGTYILPERKTNEDAKMGDLYGVVDKYGYRIVDTKSDREIYIAGNHRLDSQQIAEPGTENALSIEELKDFADQTGEELAEENGVKYLGSEMSGVNEARLPRNVSPKESYYKVTVHFDSDPVWTKEPQCVFEEALQAIYETGNATSDRDKLIVLENYLDEHARVDETNREGTIKVGESKVNEEEKETRTVIAKGIVDREEADRIAREKNGVVIPDSEDSQKFAVIVKESKVNESHFSRKHYKEIAKELKKLVPLNDDVKAFASALVRMFKEDNPRFDENLFWRTVGDRKE